MGFAKTVPRANILAGITTEHPVLETAFHSLGYQRIFQFDRVIRNALASIDPFVRPDRLGRAGIDTTPTGTTKIFCIRIVVLQFHIYNKRSNKKERAAVFCNKVAVPSNPAEPAAL